MVKNSQPATKKDFNVLKNDVAVVKNDVNGLKNDVNALKKDVNGLKNDVNGLKKDVNGLKNDVNGLKNDVNVLKNDVSGIKKDLEKFATKKDLENLELKMANRMDGIGEKIIDNVNERLIDFHDKIFTLVDSFAGEIKTTREERATQGHRLSDHETRITKLEDQVFPTP